MGKEVTQGAFSFDRYIFERATINFQNYKDGDKLKLSFSPRGRFDKKTKRFTLFFNFKAENTTIETDGLVSEVECVATFSFKAEEASFEVPDFFYVNSIAIVFPYVRAFVSSLSLLANAIPIIIPTLNLTSLKEELKNNTEVV